MMAASGIAPGPRPGQAFPDFQFTCWSDRQAWTPLMILGLTRVIIRVTRDSE